MLHRTTYQSSLGEILLLSDEQYLRGLWFNNQKYYAINYDLNQTDEKNCRPNELALKWLNQYFAGQNPDPLIVPVKPQVTEFRKKVLSELQKVAYGKTTTYKELSDQLQTKKKQKTNLAHAVGGAVGHNPIAIIIPCHRVLGSDGSLTGYAGGIDRKKALLELEKQS